MPKIVELNRDGKRVEIFPDGMIVVRTGDMFAGTRKEYSLFDFIDGNYVLQSKVDEIDRYIQLLCEAQRSGHDVHKELGAALAKYREEVGI